MVEYNVSLESKSVLVTGAAGFIGSNLIKRLFHEVKDIKIIGVDSITDYYDVIKYEWCMQVQFLFTAQTRRFFTPLMTRLMIR